MIKSVALGAAALLVFSLVGVMLWVRTAPSLSPINEALIREVINAPLPEMFLGNVGFAQSGTLRIWYQVLSPKPTEAKASKGAVLLINGLGASAAFWPEEVYKPLLDAGYQVIVTDHRSCGESDRVENWSKSNSYDLADMVNDNLAVLDVLGIDEVHVLGLSLGGMIGQEMAIRHPDRVVSLSSVMSTAYLDDPEIPASSAFQMNTLKLVLRYGLVNTEENMIKLMAGIYDFLKGDQAIDIKYISRATLYEIRNRNGFNHKLPDQQSEAMRRSGSRLALLPSLAVPVLVVHGDADPLLNIAHAKKYAALIPNKETLWVKGMGHDLAPTHVRRWMAKSVQFMDAQQ